MGELDGSRWSQISATSELVMEPIYIDIKSTGGSNAAALATSNSR